MLWERAVGKAVFTSKVDPAYDDLPEQYYHFPAQYLSRAQQALGDWILYYESRRGGGRLVYFATALLTKIVPDPTTAGHFYGYVENYLEFDHPVPMREGDHFFERGGRNTDGSTKSGWYQNSVRPIDEADYELILRAGFVATLNNNAVVSAGEVTKIPARLLPSVNDEGAEFGRPIVEKLVARPFRDRAFSAGVVGAYKKTCAVTGLQIINGGGRAEVQAAHIRSVEDGGSDSIRNGVALSGTVHWMFDRGLISIDDDYSVLVAEAKLPDAAKKMIREERKLILPERPDLRPHKSYLKFHRDNVFKG
jgi:putative restriction endonuclease